LSDLGDLDEGGLGSELEGDLSVSQSEVELSDEIDLVFEESARLFTEEDLAELRAVESVSPSAADDVGGEDEVLEEGVEDGGHGSVAGDHLLEGGLLVDDGSLGEDEGVTVLLLLNLVDDLGHKGSVVVDEDEGQVDDDGVDGLLVASGELELSNVADQGGSGGLLVDTVVRHDVVDDLGDFSVQSGGGLLLVAHRNLAFFIIFKAVYLVLKRFG
jgi:hypothetical protein